MFELEREKSTAYKAGYDDAYARYDSLSQKYIKLLEKPPQVKLGLGSFTTGVVAGAVGGVLVGRQF